MSDVFDEIISNLKQKAKSDAEIKRCMHLTEEQMQMICKLPPEKLQNYFDKLSEETKWVRLEDVESAIQQLKQNYDLVSKEFFDLLLEMEKSLDNKCKWEAKEVVSALIRRYKELLRKK